MLQLVGIARRVELVGGRDVGGHGAALPCSTSSGILTENYVLEFVIFGVFQHVGCIEKFDNKKGENLAHRIATFCHATWLPLYAP